MKKLMHLKYKGRKINIIAKECKWKIIGLMFGNKKHAEALLFNFKKPVRTKIHSLFVFFPFVALWLDYKNKVVAMKIVKPFTFSVQPRSEFYRLVEVPVSKRYKSVLSALQKS